MSSIRSKRGGHATKATRFEDTILNIKEAGALLRKPLSIVREMAQAGELEAEGWDGTQPFFKAAKVMEIAGMTPTTPRPRVESAPPKVRTEGWYWVRAGADMTPVCAHWEGGLFWVNGVSFAEHEIDAIGPQAIPPRF